jgi:hypothetical protein
MMPGLPAFANRGDASIAYREHRFVDTGVIDDQRIGV